jgi:hypothetical protein
MLSLMAKGFFAESPIIFFPVIALIIFFGVFTFITVRTLRRDKSELSQLAQLPFAETPEQGAEQ